MKVNSFNSKVNLPKFCAKLGYTGYQYVRLPTFGWYAYNQEKTVVANIFDLVSPQERDQVYALISKESPEYLDFDLAYSNLSQSKLSYNLLEIQLWSGALALARKELDTYKITFDGKKQLLKEVLIAHGLSGLIANKVGVISSEVLKQFDMLSWPKQDIRGKLLLPSFCTPNHICSLEYFKWDSPTNLTPLWLNDEKGWYGDIRAGKVISDMKDLCTTHGCTWDYKADYWFNDRIIELSDTLSVEDCLRIWTDSQHTTFSKSPLTQIIDSGKVSDLKAHVGQLNYTQLQQIEEATGEKLLPYWKRAREQQIQIGNKTFLNRDNRYYVYKKGNLLEITNFAIEIEKITRKGKKFVRSGFLYFGTQVIPFEMDEKYFSTPYMFHKGITEKFLGSGLGVPIVDPEFHTKALLIINSFNSDVKIEVSQDPE